jgi:hypothetical protein
LAERNLLAGLTCFTPTEADMSQELPMWWRVMILLNVSFYNLLGNAYAAGVPPLFMLIMQEFGVSQVQASELSTYVLLTLGISVRSSLSPSFDEWV